MIDMIKYMMEIQTWVDSILKKKFAELFRRLDTFLSDEALADNYDSDDNTICSSLDDLSQADVDFLDDCSLDAFNSELVEHVSESSALGTVKYISNCPLEFTMQVSLIYIYV